MDTNKSGSVQKLDVHEVDIQLNADIPEKLQSCRPKPSAMCRQRKIKLSILGVGRFELQDTWTTVEECKDNSHE